MKKKLDKTDKALFQAMTLTDVMTIAFIAFIGLSGIVCIVYGIQYEAAAMICYGVVFLVFMAPFVGMAFWVFQRAVLSSYCDIKLIRNALIGKDSAYLEKLTDGKEETLGWEDEKKAAPSGGSPLLLRADALRELKGLLDQNVLTQEEFEAEKRKILRAAQNAQEQDA